MRNRLALGLIASVMIATGACSTSTTPLTPITDDDGDFAYSVKNLKDTSLERTDDLRYLVFVEKTSGKPEKVVLSSENVPEGMDIFFEPVNGVDASFNTTMVIKTLRTPEGTYSVNIKGASPTTGITDNYINLKVLPYSNAAVGLVGDFTETANCSQIGNITEDVTIITDDATENKIILRGLFSGVKTNEIYATIDPSNKTLTIPSQEQNSVIYSGDGTYDDNKLIINYNIKGTTINESCTSTLTRK